LSKGQGNSGEVGPEEQGLRARAVGNLKSGTIVLALGGIEFVSQEKGAKKEQL
jgi:hypothetical protein